MARRDCLAPGGRAWHYHVAWSSRRAFGASAVGERTARLRDGSRSAAQARAGRAHGIAIHLDRAPCIARRRGRSNCLQTGNSPLCRRPWSPYGAGVVLPDGPSVQAQLATQRLHAEQASMEGDDDEAPKFLTSPWPTPGLPARITL